MTDFSHRAPAPETARSALAAWAATGGAGVTAADARDCIETGNDGLESSHMAQHLLSLRFCGSRNYQACIGDDAIEAAHANPGQPCPFVSQVRRKAGRA